MAQLSFIKAIWLESWRNTHETCLDLFKFLCVLKGDRKDVALNQTNLGLTTAISLFVHQSLIPEFLTCLSSVREKELRRCSPFLERSSIPGDDAATDLRSNEWKAVPDIWRSSADKYGDRVVVLDPFRMVLISSVCKVLECFYHGKLKKERLSQRL
ncbi:hypothetical protein YC2023_066753 [Brassica napus]